MAGGAQKGRGKKRKNKEKDEQSKLKRNKTEKARTAIFVGAGRRATKDEKQVIRAGEAARHGRRQTGVGSCQCEGMTTRLSWKFVGNITQTDMI